VTRGDDRADTADDQQPLCRLPDSVRHELKEPLGPIETDAEVLLEAVDGPLFAIGDVVTYHFLQAGRRPDVAMVDGRTKRTAVDEDVERVVLEDDATMLRATNPPATLTESILEALVAAHERAEPITVVVDGEEDLAVLPALLVAPAGASVVYGQPDVGMVHVVVDESVRARARDLLERFEGETARALALLER